MLYFLYTSTSSSTFKIQMTLVNKHTELREMKHSFSYTKFLKIQIYNTRIKQRYTKES